ncbi:MAG: DNA mismatch repair endonuclease MutL [candidate division WS1 bacterium]|jgi:DNA mismatch repair protein MutL|nr:DNA mismatch repair endonuclease MutL [candidate division WS1 bacterium]
MPKIHVLPENLANRIAAGEVVERPASIVKELVENALDAEARRIEVRLQDGGRRLIQVTDDGQGMSAEDLVLAVQRFATSKLSDADSLHAIATLGFRGEALPSIGAVAHLKITSRPPEQETATSVLVEGGEITNLVETGAAPGTTVTVANLFYNTPARLKFLATSATERGHCVDWVVRLALAHPEVSFRVLHNEAEVLSTRGTGELSEVLAAAFGSNTVRELLPVHLEVPGFRLQGFTSTPRLLRATRAQQFFFVNRRYVRSRSLGHALTEAYGMLLPVGRQPLCVLSYDLSPLEVDPNVHPTKIEVRFQRPGEMHALTERAVTEALAAAGYRSLSQTGHQFRAGSGVSSEPSGADSRPAFLPAGKLKTPDFEHHGRIERLRVNPFFEEVDERDVGLEVHETPLVSDSVTEAQQRRPSEEGPAYGEPTVHGQLWARYLIVGAEAHLLLVDQHRAAERVLFERLQATERQVASQLLAIPQPLELTGPEFAALQENQEPLTALGFLLEEFGGTSFLVRGVPAGILHGNPLDTLRDLAADLAEHGAGHQETQELLATISCHAAIKAGQHLSTVEMQTLVRDLLATQAPEVCPHGDPIILSFPATQLDRRFRR